MPIVRQTQQLSGGEMHKESLSAMPVVFTSSYMGYGVEQGTTFKNTFLEFFLVIPLGLPWTYIFYRKIFLAE